MSGILGAFVLGFSALFTIVNPIGNALTFLAATTDRSPDERRVLARRIGLYSLAILLASIWFGVHVLAFLGISLGALRVAGGLAVCAQAWTMLLGPDLAQPHFDDQRDPAPSKNDPPSSR